MKNIKAAFFVIAFVLAASAATGGVFAQGAYQKPPQEIMDVLSAPASPQTSISPAKDKIALLEPLRYPPIAELAQPMLRLAGLRINPQTSGQHRQPYFVKVTLKNVADGREMPVALPAGAQIISPSWSADGKYLAAGNVTPNGIDLWIIETATAQAKMVKNLKVNTAFGSWQWMPDQRSLLVNALPRNRGAAPNYQNVTPTGPNIQEGTGRGGAVQTFQDLLRSPVDEALFDYYAASQLVTVDAAGAKINSEIGQPAIFETVSPSPDGRNILVARIQKPYSYLYPYFRFPKEVEVWDAQGKMIYRLAAIPLQDKIPVQGVQTEPRGYGWIPTEPATLMWAEALDSGDPRTKTTPRDKVMMLAAPFSAQPSEVARTEQRYVGRVFGENPGTLFVTDYNRDSQHRRIFMLDYRAKSAAPKLISDLNVNDRYRDIGSFVTKRLPNGFTVAQQIGDYVFLTAEGATPEGDRPFLRRMNLQTLQTEDIFRSGADNYEPFVAFADNQAMNFFTRRESISVPPNLFIYHRCEPKEVCTAPAPRQITNFADPTPQLRGIKKQLVKYKRADGVDLSFTLYLPPNYKEGTRLPAIVWAYPLEFTDAATAGQVSGSTSRFTQMGGTSHLFFLLQGYAVLDETTMPVVGNPETVNDTFIRQIVDSARAAIDKGVEMGVVDPERVGVGGHSYGAFMTANLLAHSDLFRAGVARSGAYNRTLTPFGFQGERRTFWEATELYTKISPFFFANKINEPILLIHGEADNNQGTFPIQSERLYAAIRGNGGTARLVMLPFESHGYAARESTEHTLWEMLNWFDKYVKNAPPRKSQAKNE
ncbi:MAG TPA: prolyl oligopeptidase family serine peptidase [Pyrinomonadaceae bacterium]|nr:prolyl oligopeptidase family serine peptidase [Pyrinomonadaceae bacterium]